MNIIAIANPKGGAGKTTTTVNLAAAVVEQGNRVLIVDLDPQGSATQWLGVRSGIQHDVNFLQNGVGIETLARPGTIAGMHIVPAPHAFLKADIELGEAPDSEFLLAAKLARFSAWDYVFLDCPASLGVLTRNALRAADLVVAPVEATVMGLLSVINLFEGAENMKRSDPRPVADIRILPCRYDGRTKHSREVVQKLNTKLGRHVFQTVIRASVRLTECPGFMESVFTYAPESSGAADYRSAAAEMMRALEAQHVHG